MLGGATVIVRVTGAAAVKLNITDCVGNERSDETQLAVTLIAPGPVAVTVLLLLPEPFNGVVGAVNVAGPLTVHSIVSGLGTVPLSNLTASAAERLPTVMD